MFIMLYGFDTSSNDVLLSPCHPGPTLGSPLPTPGETAKSRDACIVQRPCASKPSEAGASVRERASGARRVGRVGRRAAIGRGRRKQAAREERERSKAASERGASERARGRRERDDARAGRDEREAGERKEEGRENHLKMVKKGQSEAGWRAERYRCEAELASRRRPLCVWNAWEWAGIWAGKVLMFRTSHWARQCAESPL